QGFGARRGSRVTSVHGEIYRGFEVRSSVARRWLVAVITARNDSPLAVSSNDGLHPFALGLRCGQSHGPFDIGFRKGDLANECDSPSGLVAIVLVDPKSGSLPSHDFGRILVAAE